MEYWHFLTTSSTGPLLHTHALTPMQHTNDCQLDGGDEWGGRAKKKEDRATARRGLGVEGVLKRRLKKGQKDTKKTWRQGNGSMRMQHTLKQGRKGKITKIVKGREWKKKRKGLREQYLYTVLTSLSHPKPKPKWWRHVWLFLLITHPTS